jgi:stage II sporulation protein AA (anti-sigma F factor antagonist)
MAGDAAQRPIRTFQGAVNIDLPCDHLDKQQDPQEENAMEMIVRQQDQTFVIAVTGRMDAVTASQFDKRLETLMAEGAVHIIVNLRDLEYISSAGLQTILATAKKLENISGEILLADLSGAVKEVFEISGFDTIFRIFHTEEEALASI